MKTVILRILQNKYDYDKVLSRRLGKQKPKAIEKWMEKRQTEDSEKQRKSKLSTHASGISNVYHMKFLIPWKINCRGD
jgi:hypothetical protein